jgi:hypothetical protein
MELKQRTFKTPESTLRGDAASFTAFVTQNNKVLMVRSCGAQGPLDERGCTGPLPSDAYSLSPRRRRCGEMADAANPLGHGPVASSGYVLLVFLSVAVTVRVIVGEPPMPVTVKT